MTHPTTQKPAKSKHAPASLRLSSEERPRRVNFGKAVEVGDPKQLSAIWRKAQAQVVSRKTAPLKPSELARWAGHFSPAEIDALVIPKRTLARRKARRQTLTLEETDKALRLARIGAEAGRVFGDPEKSARWLRKPNSALSDRTPLELLKSEAGALAVDELLGQIDHGMFV